MFLKILIFFFPQISLKLKGLKASPDFSLDMSQIGRGENQVLEPANYVWVDI